MSIKVLIVSRNAWDNKAGNTYSNFFQEFETDQLAQLYCRDELPENDLCDNYFCISEKKLIKSIFSRKSAGTSVIKNNVVINAELVKSSEVGNKFYSIFRHYRITLLLWLRELIWFFGKWKSKELEDFICNFKPDIIYTDAYDTFYTYRVLNYVRKVSNVPYVMFHCDDQLTFRKFSLSPLFWLNRFILRLYVTKAIRYASINYCIIDEQLRVYNRIVEANYKILNKCADFNADYNSNLIQKPIRMVYAGNLHLGRWKTLRKLAEAIRIINNKDLKIQLDIYTGKSVSKNKLKKIEIDDAIIIHEYIPYVQLIEIQKKTDILLHVESFDLKERLITYLSFSTKIVDFFEMGKCVLAIGWKESAPIKYLKEKDAAMVITDISEIQNVLEGLIQQTEIISNYALKARICGQEYHDKRIVLKNFKNDLEELLTKQSVRKCI